MKNFTLFIFSLLIYFAHLEVVIAVSKGKGKGSSSKSTKSTKSNCTGKGKGKGKGGRNNICCDPAPATSCINDDDFRIDDDDDKSCKWVRNQEPRRQRNCKRDDVHNNCPISCGLCCEDDPTYTFDAGESTGERCCAWIAEHPDSRTDTYCDKYISGQMVRNACPKTCGLCKDYVSVEPSSPPTRSPTKGPSDSPTKSPTKSPSDSPTDSPTESPSDFPTTSVPSKSPTKIPTISPTKGPTKVPTKVPTTSPTKVPTKVPTTSPTKAPTKSPTKSPSDSPTKNPTTSPTSQPIAVPPPPEPTGKGKGKGKGSSSKSTKSTKSSKSKGKGKGKGNDPSPTNSPKTSSPTTTPSPTPYCKNRDDFRIDDDDEKSCKWVRNKNWRRTRDCKRPDVNFNCPISCGVCCEDDPGYMLERDFDNEPRDCAWIAKQPDVRTDNYCDTYNNGQMVRDACPKTCGLCKNYISVAPSSS